jgi:hypothetical protein
MCIFLLLRTRKRFEMLKQAELQAAYEYGVKQAYYDLQKNADMLDEAMRPENMGRTMGTEPIFLGHHDPQLGAHTDAYGHNPDAGPRTPLSEPGIREKKLGVPPSVQEMMHTAPEGTPGLQELIDRISAKGNAAAHNAGQAARSLGDGLDVAHDGAKGLLGRIGDSSLGQAVRHPNENIFKPALGLAARHPLAAGGIAAGAAGLAGMGLGAGAHHMMSND